MSLRKLSIMTIPDTILVVGSVALDTVKTPSGEAVDVLGGSATYFSVAASYFTHVKVVAVVGTDFPGEHIEFLKSRNIDLDGLEKVDGKTFRWKGQYGCDINQAQTLDTQLNVFEKFSPNLSSPYRKTPYVFLANIDPELQNKILNQIESPKLVVCDTMNHWIENRGEELKKAIEKVDILIINEAEAKQLARETNLPKAARKIMLIGPKTVIIKRGEYGVLCISRLLSQIFAIPAYPLENACDSTGAGDSFAGGFLGNLARRNKFDKKTLRESVVFGNIIGSFCVEDFSLNRYHKLKFTEIKRRYEEFRKLVSF